MSYPSPLLTILPPTLWVKTVLHSKQLIKLILRAVGKTAELIVDHVYLHWKHPAMTSIITTTVIITLYRFPYRYVASLWLDYWKTSPKLKPEVVRNAFNEADILPFKGPQNHTHPLAAANRSAATHFMESMAASLGLQSFYVQRSRSDEKAGRMGSREYYWAKDIQVKPAPLKYPGASLLCLVDVDQYIDMPMFLSRHSNMPVLIYTFQPSAVSRTAENYAFTFNEKDEVKYVVTGGATYRHQVWNYSQDHLMIREYYDDVLFKVSTYLVDRRATAPDHELIMLTPSGSWNGFTTWLCSYMLGGSCLSRLKVAHGDFTRLLSVSDRGVNMSTGRVNEFLSATIPAVLDEAVGGLASTSKYDLTLPQVQSMAKVEKEQAIPLLAYHRSLTKTKPDQVCPVPEAVRSYQFRPELYEPGAKKTMVAFMQPLVHEAFVPARTLGNELECIQARVKDVRPGQQKVSPFLLKVIKEFAEHLIPRPNELSPTDHDEVYERQNRPAQQRLLHVSFGCSPKRLIQMFQKAEPYAGIKAPRPISTINSVDKREYSRYMYAFETVVKSAPWYAFGLTPRAISERVVQILSNANSATPTDFSKYDGHGSNIMRLFERVLLMRAFKFEHHDELSDLHKSQFGLNAYGAFGTWYETYFSRGSGSPETSIFNTCFNAFIAYFHFRMTKIGGVPIEPLMAYEKLGVYGGDDGLTADANALIYVKAAKLVGQDLTIETVKRGEIGIKFLARIYSAEVWNGELNSCCDVKRQLSKFHVTVQLQQGITPLQKLAEKIRSFSLTDASTPIIGQLCEKYISLVGNPTFDPRLKPMASWLSKFDLSVQYLNVPQDWMLHHVESTMPDFDYKKFQAWISSITRVEQLLVAPLFAEPSVPKSKIPVVIEGQIVSDEEQPIPAKEPPPVNHSLRPDFISYLQSIGIQTALDIMDEPIPELEPPVVNHEVRPDFVDYLGRIGIDYNPLLNDPGT